MAVQSLEERMTIVEQELAKLKEQIQVDKKDDSEPPWKQIIGIFKDDLLFDEAEKLGREWRESQRMEYDDHADSPA